ncbi:MAG: TldD/PmbA family protein, partial [Christensenellales bacterium]
MELREFIEKLFQRAAEKGLTECEVYYEAGASFSASIFKGELTDYNVSDAQGLGFRALYRGKMGYASTQAFDEAAIEMLADAARTNAELIGSEDQQFLHDGAGEYQKIELYNPAIEDLSAAEKIALARSIEDKTVAADARVEQIKGCAVFTESQEVRIVNTKGLDAGYRANVIGGYVTPIARAGDEVNSATKLFLTADPENMGIDDMIADAVKEAVDGLVWEQPPSGAYRVVIHAEAMRDLLRVFSGIFSADSAQRGMSLFNGREGAVVAADCVTIVDDPHIAGSIGSAPFDGEGVPTYRKEVIKAGVLTTLMHNLRTAHKQGVRTTANASRPSYAATIGVSPTNFFIEPGADDLQALIGELGDGLLIAGLQGLHAGANEISGDFSLSAHGYRVMGGEVRGCVRQITVAGNFYQLLKDIERVGNDLAFGFPGGGRY